jgi:hypothetical protein
MHSSIVAGYVLVRPATAPPGWSSVPGSLITISDCIMDDLPRPEYWDWFQNPADAARAQSVTPDTTVVSVALEADDAAHLIDEMGGPGQPWFALLERNVGATGTLLGYELVGAEPSLDLHTWHCYDYADALLASRGIRVNDLGLLSTLADAQAALRWMTSLPDREAPAPVPWFVVALFAHPDDAK